jgi:hypothetical protein
MGFSRSLMKSLKLSGAGMYNVDESSLTTVNKGGKIMAPSGIKPVVMRKGGDRTENTTAVATCTAAGTVTLPPVTVSEGVTLNEGLMSEARFG